MENNSNISLKLKQLGGINLKQISSEDIYTGVNCTIFIDLDNETHDFAVVSVTAAHKTPRQRIISGEKTIESFVGGKGSFIIERDGKIDTFIVDKSATQTSWEVFPGDIIRWCADSKSDLTFIEVCEPPYQDGRFENLADN